MGQEASVPLPDGHYPEDHSTSANGTKGPRASAKALGIMIRRGNETGVEYNDRESARAAAAGGHFMTSVQDYSYHEQSYLPSQQYPASSQMTPEQEQAYILQKQKEQQQMMQHQAYKQQQQPTFSNGIPAPPHHQRSPPRDTASAAVTVMMTEPLTKSRSGKLPGTRLINSMKNLAISAKGAVVHADHSDGKSPTSDSVSDWQRQWEDDDESDAEDEEDVKMPAKGGMHSPLRPGMMNDGYSTTAVGVARLGPASPERESATMATLSPTKDQYDRQLSDGVEWDTGKQVMPQREKPSIEMFLPMLRVLGKGSFGKVRCVAFLIGIVAHYSLLTTITFISI